MDRNRRWAVFLGLLALAVILHPGSLSTAASVSAEAEIPATHYVALTFDDGPNSVYTARLLDGLRSRGASATFFLIGRQIAGNETLIRRMKAEGHQVGNHTWDHTQLKKLSTAAICAEVAKTDQALQTVLGEGDYWVRPPDGILDKSQRSCIQEPLVYWNVDPEDWKVKNAAQVADLVERHVRPGDIILMHDIYQTSVEAALQIVDDLQAEGYEFVTVRELLALGDIVPVAGQVYSNNR